MLRGTIVGTAVLAAAVGLARADDEQVLYDETVRGPVWSQTGGVWAPVDAAVTLRCTSDEPPGEDNGNRVACWSELKVAVKGKVVAKLDRGLPNIDFEAAGGNNGRIELELLPLGKASLVKVTGIAKQGDEAMMTKGTGVLLVITGKTLRPVFTWDTLDAIDPGPDADEGAMRSYERHDVIAGGERTLGVPNLLVQRFDEPDDRSPDVTVQAWNGTEYKPCPKCKPIEAADEEPPPAPRPPAPPPAVAAVPPDLLDGGQSFAPVLAAMLAGEPIDAAALANLSDDTLVKLRNAPYARHGRPFKLTSLQTFFYGPRDGARRTPLLPRATNPAFKESMLDATDRANVRAVVAEQNRRKGK